MHRARHNLKVRFRPFSRPLPDGPAAAEGGGGGGGGEFLSGGEVGRMSLGDLLGVFSLFALALSASAVSFAAEGLLERWRTRRRNRRNRRRRRSTDAFSLRMMAGEGFGHGRTFVRID